MSRERELECVIADLITEIKTLREQLAECEKERDTANKALFQMQEAAKMAFNSGIEASAKLCSETTNEAFMKTLWTLENYIRKLEKK